MSDLREALEEHIAHARLNVAFTNTQAEADEAIAGTMHKVIDAVIASLPAKDEPVPMDKFAHGWNTYRGEVLKKLQQAKSTKEQSNG